MRQREIKMEVKYQELLILSYFKSHYKKYQFNELLKIMGMTYLDLKNAIDHLLEMGCLICYGNYIVIAKKGEKLLYEMGLENFFSIVNRDTKLKKQLKIDEPYIPIDFKI